MSDETPNTDSGDAQPAPAVAPPPDAPKPTGTAAAAPAHDPRADDPPGVVVVYVAGLNAQGESL